jgi:hypothetical protein
MIIALKKSKKLKGCEIVKKCWLYLIMPTLNGQKQKIGGFLMNNNKVFNLKSIVAGDIERHKYFDRVVVVPHNGGFTGKRGQSLDRDKSIRESMYRAKEKIYGYFMANDWAYWATQTLDPENFDRFDLDEVIKKYNQKLYNLKKRSCPELKWLIVPETHKDGAWHLHMFMMGIPADRLRFSGCYHYCEGEKKPIYNWIDTEGYGFNYYLYIGDAGPKQKAKMVNYITKYITKELATERFNKKKYWTSKGLAEPTRSNTFTKDIDGILYTAEIISESTYYIKDQATGEIYNKVTDYTLYSPCPF